MFRNSVGFRVISESSQFKPLTVVIRFRFQIISAHYLINSGPNFLHIVNKIRKVRKIIEFLLWRVIGKIFVSVEFILFLIARGKQSINNYYHFIGLIKLIPNSFAIKFSVKIVLRE